MVGDGRLTAGFDAKGRLNALTWPGPGMNDHITAPAGEVPHLGAWWALESEGRVHVVTSPQASQRYIGAGTPILETVHRLDGNAIVCLQTAFVVPERDVLVCRIEALGVGQDVKAAFYCAASPVARPLPPVPIPAPALDPVNDFAMFVDKDARAAFALRPHAPGQRAWNRAREYVTGGAPPRAWHAFEEGTWLAMAPAGGGGEVALAPQEAGLGPRRLFSLTNRAARLGPGALVAIPAVDTSQARAEATVFIALGTGPDEVRAKLEGVRGQTYASLLTETRAYWQVRSGMRPLTLSTTTFAPWVTMRALLTIDLATHAETGAVAHAPLPAHEALVHPRDAGWLALALARAGKEEEGEAHLRFLAHAVRTKEAPGAPHGSMPARLYTSGEPAAPDAVLDLDAVGWWLSACQGFGQAVGQRETLRLFRELWPAVKRAGEFIASWTDPQTGALLPSWQPGRMRDGTSVDSMLAGMMGLVAAEHIAVTIGEPALPEWRPRRRALEAALQFRFFQHGEAWPLTPEMRYWLDGILPPDHWLRRPMRVGAQVWTPLDDTTLPTASDLLFPSPQPLHLANTREAALQLVRAYADEAGL